MSKTKNTRISGASSNTYYKSCSSSVSGITTTWYESWVFKSTSFCFTLAQHKWTQTSTCLWLKKSSWKRSLLYPNL